MPRRSESVNIILKNTINPKGYVNITIVWAIFCRINRRPLVSCSLLHLIALVEKGKVVAKETVKTLAGTFEDCLKIEYWYAATEKEDTTKDVSGIELITLWLAPNIGIVKFTHKSADAKVEKSLELTQYQIKSTGSGSE